MRGNLWNNPLRDASSACLQVLKDLECCLAVGWLKTTWKTCFRRMCLVMNSACGEPSGSLPDHRSWLGCAIETVRFRSANPRAFA